MSQTKKGDCEVCTTGVDVKLTLMHGNIWMCQTCMDDDIAVSTANAKQIIATSQKIDSTIQVKSDIWNATTTSFNELQAAIVANADIAPAMKASALLAEVASRIDKLTEVIFSQKAALVESENQRNAYLKQAQAIHAQLRESERAKFKQFDVNYQPKSKPVAKPKPVKPAKQSFSMAKYKAAEEKYGVPMSAIRRMVVTKGMSLEEAGETLAKMLS